MIVMLVVYAGLLGGAGFLFLTMVRGQHEAEVLREQGIDPDVNLVLTLGDEPNEVTLRDLWRRVHGSRVLGLRKRIRVRRDRRQLAAAVSNWG